MAMTDYEKAYKLGKKDYQNRLMHHQKPTLQVLDDILPPKGSYSEVSLGLVQIPTELIVGTKSAGRSNSFAGNFMPILDEGSEFAFKWGRLSTSQLEEGIREPIKAYEYMNKFYVEEGNKRVSVMKYFDVSPISGYVTRIIPKRTDELENKIYFEFLDFYRLTEMNYIWFSKEGSFAKLQRLVGKKPDEVWTYDERIDFRSAYYWFSSEYKKCPQLPITCGDAFLKLIELYGYKEICQMSTRELGNLIDKSWEEFELLAKKDKIDLKMTPSKEKKPLFSRILSPGIQRLKVAFIYEKTATSSAWTYAHELGRLHLEQTFPEDVITTYYDNVTQQTIEGVLEDAIQKGYTIIFTTTPAFVQASVKAAIKHPTIRIQNCSVNISHRYIRTYYARTYEAKFLMGAIAGAMSEDGKLAYIADYPIFGTISGINAFALGAKMINPRARVYLEWSCIKNHDEMEAIRKLHPSCISGKDMVIPEEASPFYGLFHMEEDIPRHLAMPICHWGKFYEQLIRTIMEGMWKYDDDPLEAKAINYWWGMSAGVVDVICSRNLPIGTKRLIELLKHTIVSGDLNPFAGVLYSQEKVIQPDPDKSLSPEEISSMDWLAQNVIGRIPKNDELVENALPTVKQQSTEKRG